MEIVLKRQKLSAPLDTSVYHNLKVCIHSLLHIEFSLCSPIIPHNIISLLTPSVLTSCCWWSGTRHWLIVILKGFIYLFPISQDCKQSDNWLFLPARAGRLVSSFTYGKLFTACTIFCIIPVTTRLDIANIPMKFCFTEQIINITPT